MYECGDGDLLNRPNVVFSLNITERGGWGSTCTMHGCVTRNSVPRHISSSNECDIGKCLNINCMIYITQK